MWYPSIVNQMQRGDLNFLEISPETISSPCDSYCCVDRVSMLFAGNLTTILWNMVSLTCVSKCCHDQFGSHVYVDELYIHFIEIGNIILM